MPYKIIGARQNQIVVWELARLIICLYFIESQWLCIMALFEFLLFSDFPKVNEVNVKYALLYHRSYI